MISKERITEDLVFVGKTYGTSRVLYEKYGKYSTRTVRRIFGSWSAALKELFDINMPPRMPQSITKCLTCQSLTKNPKFCSRTCSATFNNRRDNGRLVGRKLMHYICKVCGEEIGKRRKLCDSCRTMYIKVSTDGRASFRKISEVTKREISTDDTQKYRRIRSQARSIAIKQNMLKMCLICGYSLHVDCAHRKPISSFAENTLVSIINDPKNLIGLCIRCHWEYDHGYIQL